ncbi:ankyrin [Meredithblackwellia eburnea MCA 4105]
MQGLPLPLRIRSAITSSAPRPSLQHMQRLIQKLTDIRNTDPSTRQTSLALAVMAEDYPLAHWLIDMGHEEGEISRDTLGETCLHIASAKGNVDILTLYLSNYTFVLDWVNARGATPLHIAAMKGEVECARILIEAGADLDAPDLQGNTPIHYASSWGHLPVRHFILLVVKLLIDAGCVFGAKNNDDFTAADYAFTLQVQKGLEDHARAHFEQTKRQRLRKPSKAPIRSSPPNPAPSLPDTPEPGALSSNLGLGLGGPLLRNLFPRQPWPILFRRFTLHQESELILDLEGSGVSREHLPSCRPIRQAQGLYRLHLHPLARLLLS